MLRLEDGVQLGERGFLVCVDVAHLAPGLGGEHEGEREEGLGADAPEHAGDVLPCPETEVMPVGRGVVVYVDRERAEVGAVLQERVVFSCPCMRLSALRC